MPLMEKRTMERETQMHFEQRSVRAKLEVL